MPSQQVLLVVCHPREDSFTRAVASALAARASQRLPVVVHDLDHDGFDPRLTAHESTQVRDGVPGPAGDDLTARYRSDLADAAVLVAVHPNWWGKPPALMSGWLDRVLAPGVAYKLRGGAPGEPEAALDLLALVVTLGDTDLEREASVFGDPLDLIWTRCVLPYVGARRFERLHLSPVGAMSAAERTAALERAVAALDRLIGPGET